MKIYTYFDSSPLLPGQGILIRQWAKSWSDHGWEPRILHPRTAVRHPHRRRFLDMCQCEAPIQKARIMRWLALDVVGGGWLCEYDLLNVGFTPGHAREVCRSSLDWSETRMSLFHVSRAGARKIVRYDGAKFQPHWGFVSDIGDEGDLRMRGLGLVRFSTFGVTKRYGDGVTKSQAIERYLSAA